MFSKRIWIPLIVGLIAGSVTFGAYKTGAMSGGGEEKISSQPSKNVSASIEPSTNSASPAKEQTSKTEATSGGEIKPNTTPDVGIMTSGKQQNQAPSPSDKLKDWINGEISKGTMTKAVENGVYEQRKAVISSNNIVTVLEGYRISSDDISLSNGKYYVIADFSILNLSSAPYLASLSNFTLTDSRSYSYQPTHLGITNGDISGDIALGKMKRGEIAFAVPAYDRYFELQFKTGLDTIKEINFKIDTSTQIPKDKLMPHE